MKSREEMLATLTEILVEDFEIEAEDIALDTHLYEELELDSIDAVDLVVKLSEITGKKLTQMLLNESERSVTLSMN